MIDRYILRNGQPVPEPDLLKWARWVENPKNRILKQNERGDVLVSTVFLAIDYNHFGGPPLLWETMVFNGEHDGEMQRYHTREEALVGHEVMIRLAFPF